MSNAMPPAVSGHARDLWNSLRLQISPFTSSVTIDGIFFNSLTHSERIWMRDQYKAIVNVNVIFVFANNMLRVFLARADIFPPGSFITGGPGFIPVLINPTLFGNAIPPVPPALPIRANYPKIVPIRKNMVRLNKVLRPPNAFILYRKAHHEAVQAAHPGIHDNQISVILGTQWQQEDAGVRAHYKAEAAQLKQEHMKKHPDNQHHPRKASELKGRMTTKKAAALSQKKSIAQDGSVPSNHNFSGAAGNWNSNNQTSVAIYNKPDELLDRIHLYNCQQQLNKHFDGSSPKISVEDRSYHEIMSPRGPRLRKRSLLPIDPDEATFNAYINATLWF